MWPFRRADTLEPICLLCRHKAHPAPFTGSYCRGQSPMSLLFSMYLRAVWLSRKSLSLDHPDNWERHCVQPACDGRCVCCEYTPSPWVAASTRPKSAFRCNFLFFAFVVAGMNPRRPLSQLRATFAKFEDGDQLIILKMYIMILQDVGVVKLFEKRDFV